jgi:hypothetical protein
MNKPLVLAAAILGVIFLCLLASTGLCRLARFRTLCLDSSMARTMYTSSMVSLLSFWR